MKRALLIALVAVAGAIGLYVWQRGDRGGTVPPNIVLITIDTLRADRLGRGFTPNIDRLAARGVSFASLRATAPLTLPSHASLLTGTIPPVHGVRENGVVYARRHPTLARVVKDAGYRTGAFVGAYVLNRRFGLDDGFDVYDDEVPRRPDRAEMLEAERPAAAVVDAALAWLAPKPGVGTPDPGTPFFLWLHLYDPHAPYAPPPEYLERAGGNAYDGEVAYVDAQIGRMLDALDARGLAANTVVAITSDHGESLGEHGEQTHGMLLYDGALRVPLVLAGPGVAPIPDQPCHQDLAGMLLNLARLDERIPKTMSRGPRPRQDGATGMSVVCGGYAETRYPRRAGWHALTAVSDGRWKLILSSERELYDLVTDPREERNLARANPGVADALASVAAKSQPQGEAQAPIAPEAAERLRALGYVSGSTPVTSDDADAPNPARVIEAWTEFERALGLLYEGSVRPAVTILERLTSKHPDAPVFQSTYAQALRESGQPGAAVKVYKAAVAKWPSDPALFHDLAAAAREAGDRAEAMRAEQAALALDENSPMAQNGLGLLHADAGRLPDAIAAFERATKADPGNASYWTNLGNARRQSGDAQGADSAYRKALTLDPVHADALNGLGVMLVQAGRAADAVPLFERALQSEADFHEARLNLGIAYQESGQAEKAMAVYREVLATAPEGGEREAVRALLRSLKVRSTNSEGRTK